MQLVRGMHSQLVGGTNGQLVRGTNGWLLLQTSVFCKHQSEAEQRLTDKPEPSPDPAVEDPEHRAASDAPVCTLEGAIFCILENYLQNKKTEPLIALGWLLSSSHRRA